MGEDVVTEIKREKRGVTLTINGEETLWVSRAIWQEQEFCQGESFDLQEYKTWLFPRQYPEALSTAVAYLATRGRSTQEIKQKLIQKGFLEDTVEMVIYKLEKEKLLDDEAFAREWAASLNRRQMGRQRILRELWQKGIDRETAEAALEELDQQESDEGAITMAAKLLKRYMREPDERKAMQKLMAAMARRGYSFEEARIAVEKALEAAREEDE